MIVEKTNTESEFYKVDEVNIDANIKAVAEKLSNDIFVAYKE